VFFSSKRLNKRSLCSSLLICRKNFSTIVPFSVICFSKFLICSILFSQKASVINETSSNPGKFSFRIYSGCTRVTNTFS
jgi:hypothetical protein